MHQTWAWHWWVFAVALIPCAISVQFRAGMRAERRGQTQGALARHVQVIFWSLVYGAIYATFITVIVGLLLPAN